MKAYRLLLLALILIVLASCMGRRPAATKYYLIEYPYAHQDNHAPIEGETPFPGPLLIMPVNVHPAYSSHQIALREKSRQINYFSQSEWAVRPSQSFDLILALFFDRHQWFSEVKDHRSLVTEGYTLSARILTMEVIASRQVFIASLTYEFNLTDNIAKSTHSSGIVNSQRVLHSRNLNVFAETISEMFLDELYNFLNKVHTNTDDE